MLFKRGFEAQVFKACHKTPRFCGMHMTSCVASHLFPYLSFLFLIPQYNVRYCFNSGKNSFFCVRSCSRSSIQIHVIQQPLFVLFLLDLISIHHLWGVLVDITKEHMIRRKNKPIANEDDSRYYNRHHTFA
jgi:hypothetical protein